MDDPANCDRRNKRHGEGLSRLPPTKCLIEEYAGPSVVQPCMTPTRRPSVPSSDQAPPPDSSLTTEDSQRLDPPRSLVLEWVLRLACAITLLGHGWVCWNGQMPLRALLWDEGLMREFVASVFNTDWDTWVTSFEIGDRIDAAVRIHAIVFLLFAVAALVPLRKRWFRMLYLIAAADLAFLAWLKFLDAGVGLGQLAEHASQVAIPLILFLLIRNTVRSRTLELVIKAALALTFIGHGLFAIGFSSNSLWLSHPLPGHFTEMTMLCLGFESESSAERLLLLGGILDLLAAAVIFAPGRRARLAFGYMLLWGFLTALARPWAYFDAANASDSLNTWLPEALLRTPHFALPLYVLLALRANRAKNPAPQTNPHDHDPPTPDPA